jgi:hypothetical protein
MPRNHTCSDPSANSSTINCADVSNQHSFRGTNRGTHGGNSCTLEQPHASAYPVSYQRAYLAYKRTYCHPGG